MRFSEGQAIGKRQSLRAAMMDMPRLLEKIQVTRKLDATQVPCAAALFPPRGSASSQLFGLEARGKQV
jgi:hypothetical protein